VIRALLKVLRVAGDVRAASRGTLLQRLARRRIVRAVRRRMR
jgi:hypothetical protein